MGKMKNYLKHPETHAQMEELMDMRDLTLEGYTIRNRYRKGISSIPNYWDDRYRQLQRNWKTQRIMQHK